MAATNRTFDVSMVDGKVRVDLGDGTHADLLPGAANKLAGLLIREAHDAAYNNRPTTITVDFKFED